jgi:hypothetical protein
MSHSLLLKIVLSTGPSLATGEGALESLDAGVNPLMPLEMAAGGEPSLTCLADVRLGFAFSRPSRPVLALGRCAGLLDDVVRLDVAKRGLRRRRWERVASELSCLRVRRRQVTAVCGRGVGGHGLTR